MNESQLVARREIVFLHPITGEVGRYYAEQIGEVNSLGVVIHLTEQSRSLLPWHLIIQVNFHKEDEGLIKK